MKKKEKLTAEIESKLARFDEMIAGLKQRAGEQKYMEPSTEEKIKELSRKRDEAHSRLEALRQSDENTWDKLQAELKDFMDDIDKDHRKSWSHYK